jgi:hypothetical protein
MSLHKKKLLLALSFLFMTAVAGYPNYGYAGSNNNTNNNYDDSNNNDDDDDNDNDNDNDNDTSNHSEYKPESQTLHIISGCKGPSLKTLAKKVQSFYEPIIVPDNFKDDDDDDFIIVSDSSLRFKDPNDNYPVFNALKAYAKKNDDEIDYRKIGNKKGDPGHKYYILKDDSSDSKAQKLKTEISAYKNTSTSTKDIILTSSAYNDPSVSAAIAACAATDTEIQYVDPNTTISNLTITNATIINPLIDKDGKITYGAILSGEGFVKDDVPVDITDASIITGTISNPNNSSSSSSSYPILIQEITKATISVSNNSGRLSFREITDPEQSQ